MSAIENKSENRSTENAGEGVSEDTRDDKGLGLGVIFFLVAFVVCFLSGTFLFPKLLYSKKEQPFNFDHALHTSEAGDCEACHYYREDGTYSGNPKLASCLDCHSEEPLGETEDEAIFVEEYVVKGKEIPWLVYSRQPDCVFFSHAAHTIKAKMDCVECHGHIGESTVSRPYEENRLTGYSRDIWGKNIFGIKKNSWDRMKMDDCAECHKERTGHQGYCFQCHK
ncbi:MAG: cytochrome c family protein [Proteobacteria bacterium]|nr:cytochrome c family protein [Pseudomonadota bacterium]MBU1389158.1 cytochrome c family protein [Pseudomonadota bacterium]MBU1543382.1 cytochrome c family protein [Pseudomonadota bacterium]MBU2482484.1 cytochrome c family protein [Pseudomonadota bacterium]